jgi:uncharacterized protein (TIGR01777 family)
MRIVVSGASGLIGTALVPALRADGHEVTRLVRRPARAADEVRWEPANRDLDPAVLSGVDAVINLAGAGIGDKRWSAQYQRILVDSRVDSTETIAAAIAGATPRPSVLLSASGIDVYGDCGDRTLDESAPAGTGYLPKLCLAWEAATRAAEEAGTRVAHLRSGIVLSSRGGLLGKLAPLFKLGVGGRLGSGRQYMAWISLRDEIGAMRFLLTADKVRGVVNMTAPEPVTNADFTRAVGNVLHRPTLLPAPRFGLRLITGEFADEGILSSQRALPTVLLEHGYRFHDPDVTSALRWALRDEKPVDSAAA